MIFSLNDLIIVLSNMTILLNVVMEILNSKYDIYLAVNKNRMKKITHIVTYLFILSMLIRVWISYTTI